ncbi:MAG: HPF/RaiA family ribosome-associated protein [Steroidobacteraceae bacterium]|jgi:cold shock CspA family protein/ribosome-associated translation inhibitor RaiA
MKLPLQITFRDTETSPALEARILQLAARLERFSAHIMRCHVIVEEPHKHNRQGRVFDVNIDITVPTAHIAIQRAHPGSHAHEDPYVALRDAFRAARRRLADYERRHRHDVKTHVGLPRGRISELYAHEGFGRIQTDDGRVLYFHRNSVLGRPFDDLTTGTEVSFAEEAGDHGPQASTVHVIS